MGADRIGVAIGTFWLVGLVDQKTEVAISNSFDFFLFSFFIGLPTRSPVSCAQ